MGSHHRRQRCCGNCLAGEHTIDSDNWRTDFLCLVRRQCICTECDCVFQKVLVEYPRFDQRHYAPGVVGRKRRTGQRHAA